MDRISNLSDDLLLKVLSELPTKDVVATMFLSKRWKFLWTMVPKLAFDDRVNEYFGEDGVEYRVFSEYVDRFMLSHKSPVLEALKFDLSCYLSTTEDLSTWIRIAIARRVRVHELEIHRTYYPHSKELTNNPFQLPLFLYTYETLVVLKLYNAITLVVPTKVGQVRLSSLKSLHLFNVHYIDLDSQHRLLAGCPVLEELVVDNSENDPAVSPFFVIVPSLKRLSIVNKHYKEKRYFQNKVMTIVPSLKYLNYVNTFDSGHICSSENMPELVEANVKLVCNRPEKLMRSLTSVKRLSLCLFRSMLEHHIEFYQLVHLELCGCCSKWWNLLTSMLQSSPKLQVLKLNKCETRYFSPISPIEGRWDQPSSVPECLLFHFNTFEWKYYYNGRREEKRVVAYILKNARQLKTAIFSAKDSYHKEKRSHTLKELVSLPKASSSCQILLD